MRTIFLATAVLASAAASMAEAKERPGREIGQSQSSIGRPNQGVGSGRPNSNQNNRRGQKPANVVVVGGSGGGYYDNGRYYDSKRYDDNDNDFLEFVGKTAAVTAGVAVVSAVIGSVVNDKPSDNCQQQIQNGQVYLLCDGVWYTPAQVNGQTGYQVVAPPVNTGR